MLDERIYDMRFVRNTCFLAKGGIVEIVVVSPHYCVYLYIYTYIYAYLYALTLMVCRQIIHV